MMLAAPKCANCGTTDNLVNTIEDLPHCEDCVQDFDPQYRKYDKFIIPALIFTIIAGTCYVGWYFYDEYRAQNPVEVVR